MFSSKFQLFRLNKVMQLSNIYLLNRSIPGKRERERTSAVLLASAGSGS